MHSYQLIQVIPLFPSFPIETPYKNKENGVFGGAKKGDLANKCSDGQTETCNRKRGTQARLSEPFSVPHLQLSESSSKTFLRTVPPTPIPQILSSLILKQKSKISLLL